MSNQPTPTGCNRDTCCCSAEPFRYTRQAATAKLSVSIKTIDRLASQGRLVKYADGGRVYITRESLVAYHLATAPPALAPEGKGADVLAIGNPFKDDLRERRDQHDKPPQQPKEAA